MLKESSVPQLNEQKLSLDEAPSPDAADSADAAPKRRRAAPVRLHEPADEREIDAAIADVRPALAVHRRPLVAGLSSGQARRRPSATSGRETKSAEIQQKLEETYQKLAEGAKYGEEAKAFALTHKLDEQKIRKWFDNRRQAERKVGPRRKKRPAQAPVVSAADARAQRAARGRGTTAKASKSQGSG